MKFRMAVVIVALALAGTVAADAQVQPRRSGSIRHSRAPVRPGFRVALLGSKIAEGKRPRGVSQERIAAAIERREGGASRAEPGARGAADRAAASLRVGADAIESGVNEAVLGAGGGGRPRDRRNVAIAALTQLVQQGQVPGSCARAGHATRSSAGQTRCESARRVWLESRAGNGSPRGTEAETEAETKEAEAERERWWTIREGSRSAIRRSRAGEALAVRQADGNSNSNPGNNTDAGKSNPPGRGRSVNGDRRKVFSSESPPRWRRSAGPSYPLRRKSSPLSGPVRRHPHSPWTVCGSSP